MALKVGEQVQVDHLWRVRLAGNQPTYQEVRGVRPMIDDKGMLAFATIDDKLQALFAPGAWAFIVPVSEARALKVLRVDPVIHSVEVSPPEPEPAPVEDAPQPEGDHV